MKPVKEEKDIDVSEDFQELVDEGYLVRTEEEKREANKGLAQVIKPKPIKILQPMQITKLRYDYTLTEKNIFMKIVEKSQLFLSGKDMGEGSSIVMHTDELTGYEYPTLVIPIKEVARSNNYDQVREGLHRLITTTFGLPPENGWDYHEIVLFNEVFSGKEKGKIQITLSSNMWHIMKNYNVYKIIDTGVATRFKSVYAVRLYELLAGNKTAITYKIEHLKLMFKLENKYKNNKDFMKSVIIAAQKEMIEMEDCPFYFNYEVITGARRKIEELKFFVVEKNIQPKKNEKFEKLKDETKDVKALSSEVTKLLKQVFSRLVIREDVELKLKNAQLKFGVNGLCDVIRDIRQKYEKLVEEGNLKGTMESYFVGTLERMTEEKAQENTLKCNDINNLKQMSETVNEIREPGYTYYTDKELSDKAILLSMTIDEMIKTYNVEFVKENTWRVKF